MKKSKVLYSYKSLGLIAGLLTVSGIASAQFVVMQPRPMGVFQPHPMLNRPQFSLYRTPTQADINKFQHMMQNCNPSQKKKLLHSSTWPFAKSQGFSVDSMPSPHVPAVTKLNTGPSFGAPTLQAINLVDPRPNDGCVDTNKDFKSFTIQPSSHDGSPMARELRLALANMETSANRKYPNGASLWNTRSSSPDAGPNGQTRINSCSEYAYQSYYTYSQFEDVSIQCKDDNRCFYAVANSGTYPISQNLPAKSKSGQVAIGQTPKLNAMANNGFFLATPDMASFVSYPKGAVMNTHADSLALMGVRNALTAEHRKSHSDASRHNILSLNGNEFAVHAQKERIARNFTDAELEDADVRNHNIKNVLVALQAAYSDVPACGRPSLPALPSVPNQLPSKLSPPSNIAEKLKRHQGAYELSKLMKTESAFPVPDERTLPGAVKPPTPPTPRTMSRGLAQMPSALKEGQYANQLKGICTGLGNQSQRFLDYCTKLINRATDSTFEASQCIDNQLRYVAALQNRTTKMLVQEYSRPKGCFDSNGAAVCDWSYKYFRSLYSNLYQGERSQAYDTCTTVMGAHSTNLAVGVSLTPNVKKYQQTSDGEFKEVGQWQSGEMLSNTENFSRYLVDLPEHKKVMAAQDALKKQQEKLNQSLPEQKKGQTVTGRGKSISGGDKYGDDQWNVNYKYDAGFSIKPDSCGLSAEAGGSASAGAKVFGKDITVLSTEQKGKAGPSGISVVSYLKVFGKDLYSINKNGKTDADKNKLEIKNDMMNINIAKDKWSTSFPSDQGLNVTIWAWFIPVTVGFKVDLAAGFSLDLNLNPFSCPQWKTQNTESPNTKTSGANSDGSKNNYESLFDLDPIQHHEGANKDLPKKKPGDGIFSKGGKGAGFIGLTFLPSIQSDVVASAAIGWPGFRAGIKGALNLVKFVVPLSAGIGFSLVNDPKLPKDSKTTTDNLNSLEIGFKAQADLLVSTLSGNISLFGELGPLKGEHEIVKWDGFKWEFPIFKLYYPVVSIPLTQLDALFGEIKK